MKRRIASLLVILILATSFQHGCWSRKEMNELALALGAAVDRTPDGKFLLTLQFAKPGEFAAGAPEGGKGKVSAPVWVVSATGKTIFEAERNLAMQVSRHIYWGHLIVLIIGEKAARHGVREVVSLFLRSPQPRETMWVMVTEGEAKNLLMSQPGLEKSSAQAIGFLARSKAGYSVELKDFAAMLASKGGEPIASRLGSLKMVTTPSLGQKTPVEEVRISGVAAFKDDKLTGWLDPAETRGLLWLKGEVGKGVVTVPCPGKPEKQLSLEIIRATTKVIPEYRNNKVSFTVRLMLEGDLEEEQCDENLTKPETIKAIEKELRNDVKQKAELALSKAQDEFKADIFGFGEAFHRAHKKEWRKLKDNWNEEFARAEVRISVKAYLRRTGLLTKPATLRE